MLNKKIFSPFYIISILILIQFTVFSQLKPIRIACVGNSITWGGLGDKSYPQQLGKLLGNHYEVKNFGISARALLRKSDYPYWNEQTFSEAKEFEAQIIIIKLGTNDTKPQNWIYGNEFFSNYIDFINEFRKGPVKPQIFVCYPCPVFMTAWGIRDSIVKLIIPIIDSVRNTANTDLIDFNTPLLNSASLFPDGVHPNADGYLLMAQIAQGAILNSAAGIIRTFNSNKYSLDKGESCKLYWETTNGSEVTINGDPVNGTDSLLVTLNETKSFTLIAKGQDRIDTMRIVLNYIPPGTIKSFYCKPRMLEIGANDSSKIYWNTSSGSQVLFDDTPVGANDSITVSPLSTTYYKLNTSGDTADFKEISIQVLPAEEINRSLDRFVKSSSASKYYPPEQAIDGNPFTYWKSRNEAAPWIYIDFEKEFYFERVILDWGDNYGISYRLQAISPAGVITTIYDQSSGSGGREDILLSGSGRYLRLMCTKKFIADSGYALNEFEIYGRNKVTEIVNESNFIHHFGLYQNYPNPFNPKTRIQYSISSIGNVSLKVFDILGNLVVTLVNEAKQPGTYEVDFNASNLSSGIYFYSLQLNSLIENKKMIILK